MTCRISNRILIYQTQDKHTNFDLLKYKNWKEVKWNDIRKCKSSWYIFCSLHWCEHNQMDICFPRYKMELVFNILEIEYVLIVDFVTRLKICVIPNVNFAIPWQSQVIKLVLVKSYSTSYHYVLIEFVVNYTKISLQFQ